MILWVVMQVQIISVFNKACSHYFIVMLIATAYPSSMSCDAQKREECQMWVQAFSVSEIKYKQLGVSTGNALRHKLLRPGGAKDPQDLITGVLGHDSLQQAGGGYMPLSDGLLHHYGIPTAAWMVLNWKAV